MHKQDLIDQYEAAARRWEEPDNHDYPEAPIYFRMIVAHIKKHGEEPSIHIAQELHEQAINQVKQERSKANA